MTDSKKIIDILGENGIKLKEPMAKHTSLKVGGPAEFYFEAKTEGELIKTINKAKKNGLPIFVFGGGTNLLVSEDGIKGLTIRFCGEKVEMNEESKVVKVKAGAILSKVALELIPKGISCGLEYFATIPGTVGGAIWNNAHWKEKQIGDYVFKGSIFDGKKREVSHDYFKFSYDFSILKEKKDILLSAYFKYKNGDKEKMRQLVIENNIERKEKQPLNYPSAGCTFQNLSEEERLRIKAPTRSVGWLLEECGLKGKNIGGAQISEKHANFIVNLGNATVNDIVKLIDLCKEKAQEKYGLVLKEEIRKVGEF